MNDQHFADVTTGETVRVPAGEPTSNLKTGKKHRVFVLRRLRMKLHDDEGDPLSGCSFELQLGDSVQQGTLDEEGNIRGEIPDAVTGGTLKVWPGEPGTDEQAYTYTLKFR